MLDTLRTLFVHCDWARAKLMGAVSGLSGEQLDRAFELGPGSLRATLCHLWGAEQRWLERWTIGQANATDTPGLSVEEIAKRFEATAAARNRWLDDAGGAGSGAHSERLEFRDRDGTTRAYPLGDMMLHVANHGVHHRAQALNMLRQSGVRPPSLDWLSWQLDQNADHPETLFEPDTINEYFRYSDWAFACLVALAEGFDAARLDRAVEMGPGTLRRTLLHIEDAEAWWLKNWLGTPPTGFEQLPATTSLDELRDRHAATAAARNEILSRATPPSLEQTVAAMPGRNTHFTFHLGDTMLQLCVHGTHHRAQAINMLRREGAEPPPLDYIRWVADGSPEVHATATA